MKKLFLLLALLGTTSAWAQKQHTLSGYISDAANGEKLISATVYETAKLQGTNSNVYGFYSITLPEGNYEIVFSYIGFKTVVKQVELKSNLEINVAMEASEGEIEEITVTGQIIKRKFDNSQMSMENLSMKMVESMPVFFGEADIMKYLQLMPGVQSGSEGTSGLYVRGGSPDQNLIIIDGVPVYNASHLFGFFSVFNSDALKDVSLYKGGFPARFGGRLSSVVDVRMKEGNEKELHGGAQIGLIASKFYLEGPIVEDKTAFHISARRTYSDLITKPMSKSMSDGDDEFGYYFYDVNAKINHKFSEDSRLYLSVYAGRDKADIESEYTDEYSDEHTSSSTTDNFTSQLYWGNITTALRWNYVFNRKLFLNTTLTYSDYIFNTTQEGYSSYTWDGETDFEDYSYTYKSGITDWSAKFAFDWYPVPQHDVKFGGDYIYHTFNPGVDVYSYTENDSEPFKADNSQDKVYADELRAYVEDNFELGYRLKANVGVHLSAFHVGDTWYSSLEPRFSMNYLLTDDLSFKLSYAKMQQYLHLLTNTTIGLPTDLWLPTTEKVKPQISHQYATGLVYGGFEKVELSAEAYYKEMENVIEYTEGASFFSVGAGWEDLVASGRGKAYGVELMAKKDIGKTTGWIAYTWAKTERQFDELNFGNWFPAKYDRRHDVSIVLTHKFSEKFDIGATWVYGTGNAMSLPTQYVGVHDEDDVRWGNNLVGHLDQRNNYRMPAYHRLDLGMNFNKKKERGVRTWNISVYNAYSRQNPYYLYLQQQNDGSYALQQISLFPIIPSVSYIFKF
ncbi:MAG: TonB-dependent receptor [Mangrovibacterium sp.]